MTTHLLYDGRRIALFNPKETSDGDWRIVRVNVRRFDVGFRRDGDRYIGHGDSDYWPERLAAMKGGVLDGTILKPPIVYVDPDGVASFEDGRHRYAALRDVGRRTMSAESRANAERWGYLWGRTQ